ncbi:hypothetical protein ACFP3I_16875 [Chryseobacterium arachidis]|uniref:hypothetical protein n=1 Tax=Chryseobacterium arachidis TaxID=1416778 RepID=UPI0009336A41
MYREQIDFQNYKLLDTIFFKNLLEATKNKLKCRTDFIKQYMLINRLLAPLTFQTGTLLKKLSKNLYFVETLLIWLSLIYIESF